MNLSILFLFDEKICIVLVKKVLDFGIIVIFDELDWTFPDNNYFTEKKCIALLQKSYVMSKNMSSQV